MVKAVLTTQGAHTADPIPVVAQMLKEDADSAEQRRFLEATRGSRLANGANVIRVVATCLPFIQLFESCPMGDVKSYLGHMAEDFMTLAERGIIMRFCKEIACGVHALHEVGAIPEDLALRCCHLTQDMTVKVGDFGLARATYIEDYVPVGSGEHLPVRWLPPELLEIYDQLPDQEDENDRVEIPRTRKHGVWSLGVTLWEAASAPNRPFNAVADSAFVLTAKTAPLTLAAQIGPLRLEGADAEAIQSVLELCLRPDANARPDCDRLRSYLDDFYSSRMAAKEDASLQRRSRKSSSSSSSSSSPEGENEGDDNSACD